MTRYLIAILFFCIPVILSSQPHLLQSQVTPREIELSLLTASEWHPFPTIEDREAWDNLPTQMREHISSNAEEVSDYAWPTLSATLYLTYARTGSRSEYSKLYSQRRVNLCKLVLAECLEAQGRYLDQIVNGVWAVCEESTWMVPAHITYFKNPVGLPNVEQPRVDLFSAETGAMLSWIDYLLGRKLDEISPLVRKRLKYEVKTRILDVNFEHTEFRWMGYNKSIRRPNNWNPWICSNWLKCILLSDDTLQSKAKQIYKLLEVLDNYVDPHPKDGGCDEGHNYWDRAAGCVFDVFDLLAGASQGKIDFLDEPLIKNMGRYLYSVFIDDRYFVNFADSRAIGYSEPPLVYRFGQKIGDDKLKAFGAYLSRRKGLSLSSRDLFWNLNAVFLFDEINHADASLTYTRDVYFPDIQIMAARSEKESANGFFVCAKGGNNEESHNHNDIGQFVLYFNGKPVIIDGGKDTYTALTFSKKRYTLWNTQSGSHNVPLLNGIMQHEGASFKATDVTYRQNDDRAVFSLDISGAYPAEARITKWQRTIELVRQKGVMLSEEYEMAGHDFEIENNFLTPCRVETGQAGYVVFIQDDGSQIRMAYDEKMFTARTKRIHFDKRENQGLHSVWGDSLTQVIIYNDDLPAVGKFKFEFTLNQVAAEGKN